MKQQWFEALSRLGHVGKGLEEKVPPLLQAGRSQKIKPKNCGTGSESSLTSVNDCMTSWMTSGLRKRTWRLPIVSLSYRLPIACGTGS